MPDTLQRRQPTRPLPVFGSPLTALSIALLTVGALYLGREVWVPIALALLLSFVLAPLVRFLQEWYFPRYLAVGVVALLAFSIIFGLGTFMVAQVNQLASDLPGYQSTLSDKIHSLRGVAGGTGTLERASDVLKDLSKEIDRPNATSPLVPKGQDGADRPIPVEVRQPGPGALQTLAALIAPVIHPLTTTGIVVIFVIFILLQRQDLRNRVVRLAGAQDLQRTTAALDDAGQRLSHLFLSQLALNTAFGVAIGAGLWIIGVPSAPLWGMLAMILRFVPYIGAVISAAFPLILAAAVGPGWTMVVMTAFLFLILEPIFAYAIEPLVFGKSTGLSPVAIIVSATFWTWLWGPIGLILATPLTLCLVVVGRHVDRLNFLEVLLGDQPALTPPEIVYQRMLARDPVEAAEQAQTFLKEKPLAAYYDEILLEGLRLAQADAERNLLDEERMLRIRDAVAEIVDDLNTHKDQQVDSPAAEEGASPLAQPNKAKTSRSEIAPPERWSNKNAVLCVPGIGLLDEAAALMIAHLVLRNGINARAEQADTLSMSRLFAWDTSDVCLICICYVESATAAQIRYAIRRVRRRAPDALILVALLGTDSQIEGLEQSEKTDFVQPSVRTAAEKIFDVARASCVQESSAAVKAAV